MATIGATAGRRQATTQVVWAAVDAPVGTLLVAATPNGLVRVDVASPTLDAFVVDLTTRLGALAIESPGRLDAVRRQLDEFFAGSRRRFDLPLDWSLTTDFQHDVLDACRRVPYGATTTCGGLAGELDRPNAAASVGAAVAANPLPVVVPCHRVVRRGGTSAPTRAWLLAHEARSRS